MTTIPGELTVELRSADGTSAEFYQTDEERIQETLHLLAAPRLLAQSHLVLASERSASVIPCRGIDMIFARTSARTPLKFPLNLPVGLFDIVEQPEGCPDKRPAAIEAQNEPEHGQRRRRSLLVEIHTLGGWMVILKAVAMIRGNALDESQWFGHLPEVPTIPFRLPEGGFGLLNTANITHACASPKPDALPGISLPLAWRRRTGPGKAKPL